MDALLNDDYSGRYYTHWTEVADRFMDDRDCFTAYLALELAEVIDGEKPGNLICLVNRLRSCNLNVYELWHLYGDGILAESGLKARVLTDRNDSILVYIYREDLLQAQLKRKPTGIILAKLGYLKPDDLELALSELGERTGERTVPHEIGIFLGYPLKDVLGFMGRVRIEFSCQGPWKIFGDPASSLELAGRFRKCRMRMAGKLLLCSNPFSCLQARVADGYNRLGTGFVQY